MATRKRHVSAHHVEPLLSAAATEVHDDPHLQEPTPTVFTLTADQIALIRSLHFLTEYEIAHLRKPSADVADAFDANVLAAITAHSELGGKARADRVLAAKARYEALSTIAGILSPLARIVGQALLQTGASLALEASEPLKVARGLKASQPDLLEKLATLDAWSYDHPRRAKVQPAAAAKPASVAAA